MIERRAPLEIVATALQALVRHAAVEPVVADVAGRAFIPVLLHFLAFDLLSARSASIGKFKLLTCEFVNLLAAGWLALKFVSDLQNKFNKRQLLNY